MVGGRTDATGGASAHRRSSKRDSILESAARLIRTEGVHAASMAALSKEASASAGSIYHHFANKNDIVLAVAQSAVVEPMRAAVRSHHGEALSPADMFRMITSTVLHGEVQSALIVQLWAGSSREPQLKDILRRQLRDVHDEMIAQIATWLAARGVADASGRAEGLALVTMGQAMGLLAQRTLNPELDEAAYVAEACRILDASASA